MNDIVLVAPPNCLFDPLANNWRLVPETTKPPMGLLYLGTTLKQAGYDVKIIDLNVEIGFPLKSIKELLDESFRVIKQQCSHVIGFTSMFQNFPIALALAKRLKENNPELIVIMGGPHATFLSKEILEYLPFIDLIVRKEGERTLLDLMNCLSNCKFNLKTEELRKIYGISFRDDGGKVVHNEPRSYLQLDQLPFPDFSLCKSIEHYQGDLYGFEVPINTGRGCPFNCIFCNVKQTWGMRRVRSPTNIAAEIQLRVNQFKEREEPLFINFFDDEFMVNKKWMKEVCAEIIQKAFDIKWLSGSRIDTLDVKDIKYLKKAKCNTLFFGVESSSRRVQKYIGKYPRIDVPSRIKNLVKSCLSLGIKTIASFMIGFPIEKEEEVKNTLKLCSDLSSIGGGLLVNPVYPLPGTNLWYELMSGNVDIMFVEDPSLEEVFEECYEEPLNLGDLKKDELWRFVGLFVTKPHSIKEEDFKIYLEMGFELNTASEGIFI